MIWSIIESISSLISAASIVSVAYNFRLQRHRDANILSAVPVIGTDKKQHGVLLENSGDTSVHRVQMRICGKWDWDQAVSTVDLVLPEKRGNFSCWANIATGQWYVDGTASPGPNKFYAQLYISRFDRRKNECTPIFSDASNSVFYVSELVYSDSRGNRWLRKAEKNNKLCLGSAKKVSKNYMLNDSK